MKPKTLICVIVISMAGLFYISVIKPLYANYTFSQFLQKTQYESYDEYLSVARKNLAFEDNLITYQIADFAKAFLFSDASPEFSFKLADETAAALKKIQMRSIENYLTSFKLAELLIVMSARDKKYLPQASDAVERCLSITPEHPYNEMLKRWLTKDGVYD